MITFSIGINHFKTKHFFRINHFVIDVCGFKYKYVVQINKFVYFSLSFYMLCILSSNLLVNGVNKKIFNLMLKRLLKIVSF